jgi:hypothetical protein
MEASIAERCSIVIQMTEDNNHLTLIPCFPKSSTELIRNLAQVVWGHLVYVAQGALF